MSIPFGERLAIAVKQKGSPVCVGLDPRLSQLPEAIRVASNAPMRDQAQAFETFCLEVIDATHDLAPVVKPQSAFFEELGPEGTAALGRVVRYATSRGLLVIMDAKRNDIGTTATAYANAYLGAGPIGSSTYSPWGADSLTVSPYLGSDSLEPFVARCNAADAGLFVLVKTSNPGSGFLQDLIVDSRTISDRVAEYVQQQTLATLGESGFGSIGAVVGATYPEQLRQMRQRMPNAWLLIPGYGAQGGSAADVVHGMDAQGLGAVVNSSRGIIFAYENSRYKNSSSWQSAVRSAAQEMAEAIRNARSSQN